MTKKIEINLLCYFMDISLNTIGYLMSDSTYKKISESKDKKKYK